MKNLSISGSLNPPPLNGGLGGASVSISDYAGKVLTDAFGNPLGTRYDAGGNVTQIGTGVITTMTVNDVNNPAKNPFNLKVGEAIIKNLAPGKYGITVNSVAPGLTETEGTLVSPHANAFDFVQSLQAIPRRGLARDIAPAVAFLVSEEAAWVTGSMLVVDGGHTRH